MDFQQWNQHFQSNQNHFDHIQWKGEIELDGYEEALIRSAIQQFQKGEDSDGLHLLTLSKKLNDPAYTQAIKGLIREEQTHASILAQFMEQEKIPLVQSHWVDGLFKRFIRTPSLLLTIMLLTCAEVIAFTFYDALKKATYSKTLKAICDQILTDEAQHLNFQASALNTFHKNQNQITQFLSRSIHFMLMVAALLFVWVQYRKVFQIGGYGFKKFTVSILLTFFEVEQKVSGFSPIPSPKEKRTQYAH